MSEVLHSWAAASRTIIRGIWSLLGLTVHSRLPTRPKTYAVFSVFWEASGRLVASLAERQQVEPPPNNEEGLRCAASSMVAQCRGELAPLVCTGHCAASAQRGEMRSVTRMPRIHTHTDRVDTKLILPHLLHETSSDLPVGASRKQADFFANSQERHDASQQQVRIV